MAQLKRKDIYEGGNPFKDIQAAINKLIKSETELKKQNDELIKSYRNISKNNTGESAKELISYTEKQTTVNAKLETTQKALTALEKERLAIEQKTKKVFAQTLAASEKRNKVLLKGREVLKEKNKATREEIQLEKALKQKIDAEGKSIKEIEQINRKLVIQRKNINLTTKEGKNQYENLTKAIRKNETRLQKYDEEINRHQKKVGRYTDAINGLIRRFIGALGLAGALTTVISLFKNGFRTIVQFNKSVSVLKSISGATTKEVKLLSNQAKDLGASTQFTAKQIIELDTELAKLGFSSGQIHDAVKGIQALAASTGIDLTEAAQIAGSTLRIFGLNASESARVADVLALSTTKSALDMAKLSTALPIVGTTAKIAGFSLEKTVGLLGVLANNGIDASTAATGLRNVFLELSKKGLTWEEAQKKILTATDKNKVAMELFGKRSATTAIVLSENTKKANDLTAALIKANGATGNMAKTMNDNLAGDIVKTQSAWDGFILSLNSGKGTISRVGRSLTQLFSGAIYGLTNINKYGAGNVAIVKKTLDDNDNNLTKSLDHIIQIAKWGDVLGKNLSPNVTKQGQLLFDNFIKSGADLTRSLRRKFTTLGVDMSSITKSAADVIREQNAKAAKDKADKEKAAKDKIIKLTAEQIAKNKEYAKQRLIDAEIVKNGLIDNVKIELKTETDAQNEIAKRDKKLKNDEIDRTTAKLAKEKALKDKALADDLARQEANKEAWKQLAGDSINTMFSMFAQVTLMSDKAKNEIDNYNQQILLMALDTTAKIIELAIAQIVAKEIGEKSFVGIATAAVLTGIVEGAFQAAKSNILANNKQQYATGGEVHGDGTATSDSIDAKLSNGEFVIKANAYKDSKVLTNAINKGYLKDNNFSNIKSSNGLNDLYLRKIATNTENNAYTYEKDGFIYVKFANGSTKKILK